MYLYLIERTDIVDYDQPESWVVAAADGDEAAALVGYNQITIKLIGEAYARNAEIIHTSTIWG